MNKRKFQVTIEYIVAISLIVIGVIIAVVIYMHSSSNIKIGNINNLLAIAYFSGKNGSYICNATELENSCYEILLTNPLPNYPIYNLSYWSKEDENSNYTFELNKDRYILSLVSPCQNQFVNGSSFQTKLDNFYNINYIGEINGYYAYIINAHFSLNQTPAFISAISIGEYEPNLLGRIKKSTYISPLDGGVLPIIVYKNATSLLYLRPSKAVISYKCPNSNISKSSRSILYVVEKGLLANDYISFKETFENKTIKTESYAITSSNSVTFLINDINSTPEKVFLNITATNSNGKIIGIKNIATLDNGTIYVNFTQPLFTIEVFAEEKTIGPFIITLPNNVSISHLLVTINGAYVNNSSSIDPAYIASVSGNVIALFVKNETNKLFLNFMDTSELSSHGPTGEAPNMSVPYGYYDDGSIVFQQYNNFSNQTNQMIYPFQPGWFKSLNSTHLFFDNSTYFWIFNNSNFSTNGNQALNVQYKDGMYIYPTSNKWFGNLYLPIISGEYYILGGFYPTDGSFNVGLSEIIPLPFLNYNNTNDSFWTYGAFARGACGNLSYFHATAPNLTCGSQNNPFFLNTNKGINTFGIFTTEWIFGKITFPLSNESYKSIFYPFIGYFTIEDENSTPVFYYLISTNKPVQTEICSHYTSATTVHCKKLHTQYV